MNEITRILANIGHDDEKASKQLLPLVYEELRRLARSKMAQEAAGHTLTPTALVHEAYLRLVGAVGGNQWQGRAHFFAAAAEAMRRILVESARRKQSKKRGGDMHRVELDDVNRVSPPQLADLLAIDEALEKFESQWPDKAKLVKLRYFVGMTIPEAAEAMGISVATAERIWKFSRVWLFTELMEPDT